MSEEVQQNAFVTFIMNPISKMFGAIKNKDFEVLLKMAKTINV